MDIINDDQLEKLQELVADSGPMTTVTLCNPVTVSVRAICCVVHDIYYLYLKNMRLTYIRFFVCNCFAKKLVRISIIVSYIQIKACLCLVHVVCQHDSIYNEY